MGFGEFLLILGASARLTHLITRDTITAPLRELRWLPAWASFFLTCTWCAGLWVAGLVTAAWALAPGSWFVLGAVALSANLLWSMIFTLYERVYQLADAAIETRSKPDVTVPTAPVKLRGRLITQKAV